MRAATRTRYQSSRDMSISSALAASHMWAGSLEPTIGMILLGCFSNHASAIVVLEAWYRSCQRVEQLLQFQKTVAAGVFLWNITPSSKNPASQRTPGEWRNLLGDALIQCAIVEAVEAAEVNFHLVHNQSHRAMTLEGVEKRGAEIADAKFTYFALALKPIERLRDLWRVH